VLIYKILRAEEWAGFEAAGRFDGSPDDLRDGFIHCSTREQAPATAQRFFAGESRLVIAVLETRELGDTVRWEEASHGGHFPHIYGPAPLGAVTATYFADGASAVGAVLPAELPEPTVPADSRAEVFGRYLDFFRATVAAKLRALPEEALRTSALPSGWTPLELLRHLTYMERRWLEWTFEGEPVPDPWGDRQGGQRNGRWHVGPSETLEGLLAALDERAAKSRQIIGRHSLEETGPPGEGWRGGPPATLERVLFHMLQEYARHVGHLDIVAELSGTATGE